MMHPPKIVTFDVPAHISVDNKGFVRAVQEYGSPRTAST